MNLNTALKMPNRVKFYYLIKLILLTLFAIFLFSLPGSRIFRLVMTWLIVFFIDIPVFIYLLLDYRNFSFIVKDNDIIVNSGILTKRSKLIPFDKIQNIDLKSGLLMRLLGLTRVNIWTSSPAQIKIRNRQSEHTPDSFITLDAEDATWLQNFISHKVH